ncbi:acyltransferase domain-containing protein [Archangium sp.]|uniref:acyltransferase domain-containing protein n=1 Tax=Archangium sp. TaxID=1872627 RepID=UPI00389B2618
MASSANDKRALLAQLLREKAQKAKPASPSLHVLTLSARGEAELDEATARLATYLEHHPEVDVADVAYTLRTDRRTDEYRRAVICRDVADARAALKDETRVLDGSGTNTRRPVVFLCSGQGTQHVGMGRTLYESAPVFREAMDACADTLEPHLGRDLREIIYPAPGREEEAEALINQIEWAQPAQFAVEYALAKWWMALGVEPEAMIGHSLGEYVAACLAGVFPLEDALRLVSVRGRLMQSLPPGAMLSVNLPEAELTPLLPPGANIGAMNGPALQMVSGTREAVAALEELLAGRGVETRRLFVSHASHSAMMDPVLETFTQEVSRLRLSPPKLSYVSTLTGTWVTAEQATDPKAWTRHLRQPVRFAEGATVLLRDPERVFLEVGPGNALGTLMRGNAPAGVPPTVLTSLPRPKEPRDAAWHALETAARLWLAGAKVELSKLYGQEPRRRVQLPDSLSPGQEAS